MISRTAPNSEVNQLQSENRKNTGNGSQLTLHYLGDKEIPALQILKFICALLVVQIHFSSISRNIMLPLTHVAVPIFFIITGYFILDKYGQLHAERVKRMFFRILKLYIIACVCYALFYIALYSRHDSGYLSEMSTPVYWISCITTGSLPAKHLWYLIALLQGLAILYICNRFNVLKWMYVIIPLGLAINLMFGRYNILVENLNIPNNLEASRNSITIALPCLMTGMLLRYFEHRLPSNTKIIFLTLVCAIGMYIEEFLFGTKEGDIVLLTVPCAAGIFILFLRMPIASKIGSKLAKYGKTYSLDIYIWHLMIGEAIAGFLLKLNLIDVCAFVVMTVSFCVAIFLKYSRLKKLYS